MLSRLLPPAGLALAVSWPLFELLTCELRLGARPGAGLLPAEMGTKRSKKNSNFWWEVRYSVPGYAGSKGEAANSRHPSRRASSPVRYGGSNSSPVSGSSALAPSKVLHEMTSPRSDDVVR